MKHLPAIAVFVVSALTGYVASLSGVPLAWVLGSLVPTALGSIFGVDVFAPKRGRKLGQLIVGTSIGLSLTVAAVGMIATWFPVMLLTALVSILATALLCVPFSRVSRVNIPTAFFSLTPGGLAEMARTGAKEGAQREAVAFSQTIRVTLLVCILPSLLLNFGIDGGLPQNSERSLLSLDQLGIVFAVAALCVYLVRFTGANNTWMIGGLLGAGIVAASGMVEGRVPYAIFAFGQFMIGISIGARFKRESLVQLPRICLMSALFVACMTTMLFGYAVLVHLVTGLDLSGMTLSASPGGLAEMALTAQVLHLNTALITSFHVVRSFIINAYSPQFYHLFRKIGLFDKMEALLDRMVGPRRQQ
ncbi:AbrB family transcriptional regulator [Pseudaminobacter arsenicus]|uniref:AbrB family transcriptional regulator n=1 Tax=Borborobacter arsenicus TaxID=1851146 RepID=A0A432V320_9HYPH|nr:AbrB family transcriptional regulator [Pseudaminobacter arsenicus]RUM96490.1 AbrB family transcriptional regulator [Pseudaminobacter arsenicus]